MPPALDKCARAISGKIGGDRSLPAVPDTLPREGKP